MIGTGELLVILCIVLVLFGGKKLPEFARSLGLGIREFKKACQGVDEDQLIVEKDLIDPKVECLSGKKKEKILKE